MMYGSNGHVHRFLESETGKGCYCMVCGTYVMKDDKDEYYFGPEIDVLSPIKSRPEKKY